MRAAKPLTFCASSVCCLMAMGLIVLAGAAAAIWLLPALAAAVWGGLPF